MTGRFLRRVGLAVLLGSLANSGATLAQTVDPNNAASVTAWKTANNITDRVGAAVWQAIGATPDGLLLRGVLTQRDPATDRASVGVRVEHFTPAPGPAGSQVFSELDTFAVDCKAAGGGRIKQTATAFYPQHNLSGDRKDLPATDDWSPASSVDVLVPEVQAACRATSGAQVAGAGARTPTPFNINDQNAGRRWMLEQKIDEGDIHNPTWLLIGFTSEGGVFLKRILEGFESQSRQNPRAVERLERFAATPSQAGGSPTISETMDYDVNCSRKVIRKVKLTEYHDRNTSGTAAVKNFSEDWKPLGADPMLQSIYDDICVAADQELERTAGKFQVNR